MNTNNGRKLETVCFELSRISNRIGEAEEIFDHLAKNQVSPAEIRRYSDRGAHWLTPAKERLDQIIGELQSKNFCEP